MPTAACILIRRSRRSYECPQSITCPSAMIGGRVAWTLPSRAVIQTKVGLMAYLALAWAAPLHPRAAEAHRRVDLSVSRHHPSLVTLSSFATRRGAVKARPADAWPCDAIDRAPPYGRPATRARALFAALSEVECRTASESDASLFEPQARPFRADCQRSSRICFTTACGVNCVMAASLPRRRMLVAATASAEPV